MENSNFYLSQIAKLYYIDKIKQNEIARRFNITPMMVSRNLKEAEQRGLVSIHVKMPWAIEAELGKAVMQKYGLQECVALEVKEKADTALVLGGYLAEYFINVLEERSIIGLSWGHTISKFVEALTFTNVENCSLIQLTGVFISKDYSITPTRIIQEVSQKMKARIYSLNAPLYASSEEMKNQLLCDPTNKVIHEMAERSNINIIGLSNFSKNTTTFQAGVIHQEDFDELQALGAAGDLAGTFLDGQGNPLEWSKSKLYTGVPLKTIQKGKNVVCIAGEVEKAQLLRAVATKGYFKTLITSKETALELLK